MQKCGYHGNRVGTLVQEYGNHLLYKLSYSQCYAQIANYSLPRHQGWLVANLNDIVKLANLENPSLIQQSGGNVADEWVIHGVS